MPTDDQRPNELEEWLYDVLDHVIRDADIASPDYRFTGNAFTWWVARHGLPQTANDVRLMFEFAARLEQVFTDHLRRHGMNV